MSLGPRIDHLEYANIRASEGAGTTTLTSSDSRHQIFNLSASRTVVLPTTDVLAGETWILAGKSASYDLTVQASGGSALTKANSCNQDATISDGFVVLVALQDAPTLPTHWRVEHVEDEREVGGSMLGAITTAYGMRFKRTNTIVQCSFRVAPGTGTSAEFYMASSSIPVRFRPVRVQRGILTVLDNGALTTGKYELSIVNNSLAFKKINDASFSGSTGIGVTDVEKTSITWDLND